MSLDTNKLENVHRRGPNLVARCPACAADGHDKAGEHLVITPSGSFGCVIHPGVAGHDHRSTIAKLAADRTPRTLEINSRSLLASPRVIARDILRTHRTAIPDPRMHARETVPPFDKDLPCGVRTVRHPAVPTSSPLPPPVPPLHRWNFCPVAEIPLSDTPLRFSADDERLLLEYMHRQDAEVISWIVSRANIYASTHNFRNPRQCEITASLDCALWQREPHTEASDRPGQIRELLDLLRCLENAVKHFDSMKSR